MSTHTALLDDIPPKSLQQSTNLTDEQDGDRNAGWLSSYVLTDELSEPAEQLHTEVRYLQSAISDREKHDLESIEAHCCNEFLAVIKAGALRYCKDGKRNRFLKRVSEKNDEFCAIAMHYQNVLDVISNTGDYTSAIWGAVKLLLIYRVNDRELKEEVTKNLFKIGEWLTELASFSYIPRNRDMQRAITKTYAALLQFLRKASKYYKESKLARMAKVMTRPWALRFQPTVLEIQTSIQAIHQKIQLAIYTAMHQLQEGATRIEMAVEKGTQDLAFKVEEGNLLILQNHKELVAHFQEVKNLSALREDRECIAIQLWDERMRVKLKEDHARHKVDDNTRLITDFDAKEVTAEFNKIFTNLPKVKEAEVVRFKRYQPALIKMQEEDSPSVSNFQWNLTKHPQTSRWATEEGSHFLWIDGFQENTSFDWTTSISIDVQRLTLSINNGVVLSLFCAERHHVATPSLMLQVFIQQVVNQRWQDFSSARCWKHVFSIDRLQSCGNDFIKLWSLFAVCLDIARIDCIFIVLDNVDALLNTSTEEEVQLLVRFLSGLAKSEKPVCKIFATSRVNKLLPGLRDATTNIRSALPRDHFSFLHIPRGRQSGSDCVFRRQKHRLSVVGESIGPIEDEMLAEIVAGEDEKDGSGELFEMSDDDMIDAIMNETSDTYTANPSFHRRDTLPAQQPVDNSSDIDLSDLSDLDSDIELSAAPKKLEHTQKNNEIPSTDLRLSKDDILNDIFDSSESELDLSDLEVETKKRISKPAQQAQAVVDDVEEQSDDDFDYDNI